MQEGKMHAGAAKVIFQNAKALRDKPTYAEELLWNFLRAKPAGYKFRRQHPFSIYILDFYCHVLKLVIEIDGGIHDEKNVQKNDAMRQKLLEREGLTVMRFTNEEVINKIEFVISKLDAFIRGKQELL